MNTSTRYRTTLFAAFFLAVITLTAVLRGMEMVAATSIAGIMTILSAYIWSQTQRPSLHEPPKPTHKPRLPKRHAHHRRGATDVDKLEP